VGRKWCNISVLSVEVSRERNPHSIHILRPVDAGKRLEILVRDFLVQETSLPPEQASAIVAATRSPSRDARLTARELDVLRALAKGSSTSKIAALLHICGTTVNNHVQHILAKLDAHSRLEAIRRAEHAGLI
jgi:DNA-binding NarL/FixJ family response regulator